MENNRKRRISALLAVCGVLLLAVCILLAVVCGRASKKEDDLPEVRNDGKAVLWRYPGETVWQVLISLDDLRGADGKNGADGKDGSDGKKIEVKRGETYIEWRYEGGEWQNLVALSDIAGPSGSDGQSGTNGTNGKDGTNGKTPEFRVSENTLQWRYSGEELWLNLYDLSVLKGLDGINGVDGKDGTPGEKGDKGDPGEKGDKGNPGENGIDGNTPFIGENGNWWIGNTDTGVKAEGKDGQNGKDGAPGEKGDKGEKGDSGSCPGYFFAKGQIGSVPLYDMPEGRCTFAVLEQIGGSGLIVANMNGTIILKKGHVYSQNMSGSIQVRSADDSGNYSVQFTDGYDNDFCREATRIKRDGRKISITSDQYSFSFNRLYDATDGDIILTFGIEQSSYETYLVSLNNSITIIALN